jgi:hypothetical protein
MNQIFLEPIRKLPKAYMPFEGVKAFLLESDRVALLVKMDAVIE